MRIVDLVSRIRIFPVIFLTVTVSCVIAQDAGSLYREGVDRQRRGDLNGAVEVYRKSLALDRANVAARSNLGAALAGLGRYDEAVPEYEEALRSAPEGARPFLQRNLALAWYKSGRMERAAPLLESLSVAQPGNAETAMLAADCLLQLGEPARALALLEPLAGGAASNRVLAYVLGMAYLKAGKTTEAQRLLDPLLKDETSAEGRYALGMAMFTSGDYPAAVQAFRRAAELDPALPHIQSYYGQALLFTGDPDAALAAFSKQLAADRNDYEANYESGLILAKRARNAEAEELLKRAVLLRPQAAGAHFALAGELMANSKWPEARAELETTLKSWPEFGAAHEKLAAVYLQAGLKTESARETALARQFAVKAPTQQEGLRAGTIAPSFVLERSDGSGKVDIAAPEKGHTSVIVFGSYSCPNFRTAAPALNELAKSFAGRVTFLQVYIREAHSTEQWQSTMNERENVQLAPVSSAGQKREYAMMCERKLHLAFPAVVDGLNDAAEKAYQAWPSRVYVIGPDRTIRFSSALNEEDFDRCALENSIRAALPAKH